MTDEIAFVMFGVPFGIVGFHVARFHQRRWQNSNVGSRSGGSA